MKKIKYYLPGRGFLAFLFLFINACISPVNDIPDDPRTFDPPKTNLLELGSSLPYFRDYLDAMNQTNLSDILESDGPYTVFMPNQNAFSRFRKDYNISNTDELSDEILKDIILYHIIHGDWTLSSIPRGYYPTLALEKTTGNPIDLFIENNSIFRLNGIFALDEQDLSTINGTIHSIDRVINIPTMGAHLSFNEEFSLFYEVLLQNKYDVNYAVFLSEEGPYTLVAPTNEAFLTFIDENDAWNTADDIPGKVLNEILRYHLIETENLVLKEGIENKEMTTMNGQVFTILINSGNYSIQDGNGNIAHVTRKNIQAENGVIHQIDRVLLP